MTPEEFQKIKEAEKEHLRKLKKLKEAVRVLERQKKISGAVTDMTSSIEARMDEHRNAVDRVALDAARAEARLEMALEAADDDLEERSREMDDEQTLREHRAKELIRQMKTGAAGDPERTRSRKHRSEDQSDSEATTGKAVSGSGAGSGAGPAAGPAARSDKPASPDPADDAPVPDKTIGRMKP